jgi:predicted HAD superfamily phosphohydrolase
LLAVTVALVVRLKVMRGSSEDDVTKFNAKLGEGLVPKTSKMLRTIGRRTEPTTEFSIY